MTTIRRGPEFKGSDWVAQKRARVYLLVVAWFWHKVVIIIIQRLQAKLLWIIKYIILMENGKMVKWNVSR